MVWLAGQRPYETHYPFRTWARRSGERVCGAETHRKLQGVCAGCRACR